LCFVGTKSGIVAHCFRGRARWAVGYTRGELAGATWHVCLDVERPELVVPGGGRAELPVWCGVLELPGC
jgi:hypothetical protein